MDSNGQERTGADLISRTEALKAIERVPTYGDGMVFEALSHVQRDVALLPSAQPDIIRCPDCYYNDGTAYCELHFRNVKAKDFCSWAERRE